MNLGKAIKKLRTDAGVSQIQLASRIDLSQTAISQIEHGTKRPRKDTLNAIAKELKVSPAMIYFLSFEKEDIPDDKKLLYDALYPVIIDLLKKLV